MYPVSITLIHRLHLGRQKMMFVHTGQHSVDTPWWWGGSRTSRRNRRSIIISSSIAAAGDHIAVPSGLDILMTGLLYKVIFSWLAP